MGDICSLNQSTGWHACFFRHTTSVCVLQVDHTNIISCATKDAFQHFSHAAIHVGTGLRGRGLSTTTTTTRTTTAVRLKETAPLPAARPKNGDPWETSLPDAWIAEDNCSFLCLLYHFIVKLGFSWFQPITTIDTKLHRKSRFWDATFCQDQCEDRRHLWKQTPRNFAETSPVYSSLICRARMQCSARMSTSAKSTAWKLANRNYLQPIIVRRKEQVISSISSMGGMALNRAELIVRDSQEG